MNFRYRLMQFMSGRYGPDKLFYVLCAIASVMAFLNIYLVRSSVFQFCAYAVIIYAIFRFFSRNIEARRRENRFFTEKINFFKAKSDLYKQRRNDKLHIYKKCPKCKAILRLPRRVGKHTTVCPRCNHSFKVNVR